MSLEETINSYLVEDDDHQQRSLADSLAKKFSLLQIVLNLEDPLTQDDSLVRSKATKCLSDIIYSLPALNKNEFEVLCQFLSDRSSDLKSVGNAADGLRWVLSKKRSCIVPESSFWGKLKTVDMSNLDVISRYKVFQLLDTLSHQNISPSFVDVFVALAGGEKDPQNLMLNLEISQHILGTMGMSLDKDKRAEIYDITFCYFPVKFHPPKDMPYTITADEIKDKLSLTLSCPEISEWTIPALIGKLTAVSVIVKLDSIKIIRAIVRNLSKQDSLELYWRPIWDGVKYEIIHGTPENDTYRPVIDLLREFVIIPEFLESVKGEFEPSSISKSKLLQLASLVVGLSQNEDVWNESAPIAVEKSLEHSIILNLFLESKHSIPCPDQVFQALLQTIASDHKKEGVRGLELSAKNSMGKDYVPLIIQTLTQEKAYKELSELATLHSNAIRDYALPDLLSRIPETSDALSKICRVRPLVNVLSIRLLSRLDFSDESIALKLLETLIQACDNLNSPSDFSGFDRVIIMPLLDKIAEFGSERIHDVISNKVCIVLENAARGVLVESQPTYVSSVLKFLGTINFHMILSCVAAMKHFPFEHNFISQYALPKLDKAENISERAGYSRSIALTTNKWPVELDMKACFPEPLSESWENKSHYHQTDHEQKKILTSLEASAWAGKGLIVKADQNGFEIASNICKLASNDILSAKLFGVVIATDRSLAKENGCVIRNLFKQRIFLATLPMITTSNASSETSSVLSSLSKYTPQAVIASNFDKILSMLMSSLKSEASLLQETAVEAIFSSLPLSAETSKPQLHDIIPRLLLIATSSNCTSEARLGALKTIIALNQSSPTALSCFSEAIIRGVVPALGDPRRSVRKEAVKCRQAFF